jgi:hypothetical protein
MNLTRSVASRETPDAIRGRLEAYLTSRGFRIVPTGPGVLVEARRGSWVGSLTSFSPKKWGARLKVSEPRSETYRLEFEVNTTGQRVVESEIAFWDSEADGIAKLVETGDSQIADLDETSRKAVKRTIKLVLGYSILFGAVGLVIDVVNMRHGRNTSFGPIGAGVGAATGAAGGVKKPRSGS